VLPALSTGRMLVLCLLRYGDGTRGGFGVSMSLKNLNECGATARCSSCLYLLDKS
jgi:hypothetical protein